MLKVIINEVLKDYKGYLFANEVYVPHIGKCTMVFDLQESVENGAYVNVLNKHRKDVEGYSYTLENVSIYVDFEKNTMLVKWQHVYNESYVENHKETFNLSYTIKEDMTTVHAASNEPKDFIVTLVAEPIEDAVGISEDILLKIETDRPHLKQLVNNIRNATGLHKKQLERGLVDTYTTCISALTPAELFSLTKLLR